MPSVLVPTIGAETGCPVCPATTTLPTPNPTRTIVKSALREKDRGRATEHRLTEPNQRVGGTIYRAFYHRSLYKVGTANGPVAQGIEQQPSKLKVAGSNPAGVANKIGRFLQLSFVKYVACVAPCSRLFPGISD
jgi:hypothetical protein